MIQREAMEHSQDEDEGVVIYPAMRDVEGVVEVEVGPSFEGRGRGRGQAR